LLKYIIAACAVLFEKSEKQLFNKNLFTGDGDLKCFFPLPQALMMME
jgi:hypothetical protein